MNQFMNDDNDGDDAEYPAYVDHQTIPTLMPDDLTKNSSSYIESMYTDDESWSAEVRSSSQMNRNTVTYHGWPYTGLSSR